MSPLPLAIAIASRAQEELKPSIGSRRLFLPDTDTGCNLIREADRGNRFIDALRHSVAEINKCANRFDDVDPETLTIAILGVALLAEDLLGVCRQYQQGHDARYTDPGDA